ncbi:MAG: zinc-dependent dehydrogenase [Candidatus Omnitrophota bacterium]
MKVGVYYNNNDVRVEERSIPKIGPDEVLVKVIASGICGSDVMEWYRIKKAPLVLGHEISGEIAEIGENVDRYKIGDRVFVAHHVPCNTCHYCLKDEQTVCDTLLSTNYDPGGFAEYIRVPEINVDRGIFLLPEELTHEHGVFAEPLACVVRGQRKAGVRPGQSVLILGSGMSGLLHLLLARAQGAGRIMMTDIDEFRLKKAQELGADAVINAKSDIPGQVMALNSRLADIVIVCTSALTAFNQAINSVDRGGIILLFAPLDPDKYLSLPLFNVWRNGTKLIPSYGNSPPDAEEAIELMRSKKVSIDKLITHKLKLDDIAQGFNLVSQAKESIKVIIYP